MDIRQIKVLFLIPNLAHGGAEKWDGDDAGGGLRKGFRHTHAGTCHA